MNLIKRLLSGMASFIKTGVFTMAEDQNTEEQQPTDENQEDQATEEQAADASTDDQTDTSSDEPNEDTSDEKSEVEKALEKVEGVLSALGKEVGEDIKDAFDFVKKHG